MKRYLALQKVVETGSFTKAAKAMDCTQSSISQMVSSLETELSTTMLHRSRSGVELTPEGRELYPSIERYIRLYQEVQEKADEIRGLDTGIVRIGTIASITCHWMPELIWGFQKKHPNIEFVFRQGDYNEIYDAIRTGQVDFGFIPPECAGGLISEPLKQGEYVAIFPEGHRFSKRESVTLKELTDDPFILLETGSYSELSEAFYREGLKPNLKFIIHDDYTIMRMVEVGLAISMVSSLVLMDTHYRISAVPIDPPVMRTIGIAYTDPNTIPFASRTFLDYLRANVDSLP